MIRALKKLQEKVGQYHCSRGFFLIEALSTMSLEEGQNRGFDPFLKKILLRIS